MQSVVRGTRGLAKDTVSLINLRDPSNRLPSAARTTLLSIVDMADAKVKTEPDSKRKAEDEDAKPTLRPDRGHHGGGRVRRSLRWLVLLVFEEGTRTSGLSPTGGTSRVADSSGWFARRAVAGFLPAHTPPPEP